MHLAKWHVLSKPIVYGGWDIKNLEWFGTSLRLKSFWLVLNGIGIWNRIIEAKYLKNISFEDWLRKYYYSICDTSYFWKGFVRSLTWISRKLGWKVGNGLNIILGVDPVVGQNSSYLLSEDLREYLEDYGLLTLRDANNGNAVSHSHSY